MAKICLDPGHAGRNTDPGTVDPLTGLQEADVTLIIADLAVSHLQAVGHETLLTRNCWEQPETHKLVYRAELANNWDADVFVSLHCNSAADQATRGYEVWISPEQIPGGVLAVCIFKQIKGEFPYRAGRIDYADKDLGEENKFYILTQTIAPAVLIEMAFISNPAEAYLLANPVGKDRMARAIAKGITNYFAEAQSCQNRSQAVFRQN